MTDSDKPNVSDSLQVTVPTAELMRKLGQRVASCVKGGDVLVLSGPLGAGKTTFAQGFGQELHVDAPVVSPTFTIARELHGHTNTGDAIRVVHVDAYRLGSIEFEPGQSPVDTLLDELESLGLDEELDNPGDNTVVLMEWGQQMASALSEERLEIKIRRPVVPNDVLNDSADNTLTSQGLRTVSLQAVGASWITRMSQLHKIITS